MSHNVISLYACRPFVKGGVNRGKGQMFKPGLKIYPSEPLPR
jgi:hypothetical protein